jgi:hypothetical protein
MIKGIMGNKGVIVSGGDVSTPYINNNSSNPIQGMIRLWGNDFQVFDGNTWIQLSSSYATVSLDQDTHDLLQWARTQRQLEMNRATLIENNPALEKAYKAILRAEQNFDILSKFVEEDEPGIGSVLVGYNFNSP